MNNLKTLRKINGLYQKDLAKLLGVGVSTFSGWENDSYEIDFKNLFKLADYFKVSVDYLLDREDQSFFTNSKLQVLSDREIDRIYDKLDEPQQQMLLGYGKGLLEMQERNKNFNYNRLG